ncbi:MAG: ATP-dependent helicase HrpB [Planctomycetota bacterium]|nr:ATP-dependent helicase HrpB [Planctomycetota bacterium]
MMEYWNAAVHHSRFTILHPAVFVRLTPLPIDPILPEVVAVLRAHSGIVIEAPPGAGKTTRVPRALLDEGFGDTGEIWMLEPRRLATRMAANRIAWELGEEVGRRIGYAIRFESKSGPETKLRIVTEGVLLRRLSERPDLDGISTVILDEFHERHVETDIALACLLNLQRTKRPDLKIVVMSATLDAQPVAEHIGCPLIRAEGRSFPVEVDYWPGEPRQRLESKIADALRMIQAAEHAGHILVFLPGVGEILAAEKTCRPIAQANGMELLRLHGSLETAEQTKVVAPSDTPKLILATNVAESSVTIDGVTTVIDSGLVKEAGVSTWSGLPMLVITQISQASATQRAGRAGRTQAGRCIRLFTRREFEGMQDFALPELLRTDMSGLVLQLKQQGLEPSSLPWLQPPSAESLSRADLLLQRLGAMDSEGKLTSTGTEMSSYSAHPRLSRILCAAKSENLLDEAAILTAILENPDPRKSRRWQGKKRDVQGPAHVSDPLLIAEELFKSDVSAGERNRLLLTAKQYAGRNVEQVAREFSIRIGSGKTRKTLLKLLLLGFPDRVARRVSSDEVFLSTGGRAFLADESSVRDEEYMVVLEAREDIRRGRRVYVSRASAIQADWLFDLPGESLTETEELQWDQKRQRVLVVERMLYDQLVLDEQTKNATGSGAEAILFTEAKKAGLEQFFGERLPQIIGRIAFLRSNCPDCALPDKNVAELVLKEACKGKTSFRELQETDLMSFLLYGTEQNLVAQLDRLAPESLRLPSDQSLQIHYPENGAPWAKARIQAFYGVRETPAVAGGRVPLLLHLLAPNNRPAQVTDDLARFWSGSYELVRKELRGRYPKHHWPDDPANARPVQLKKNV